MNTVRIAIIDDDADERKTLQASFERLAQESGSAIVIIEFAGAGYSLRTRMNECSRLIILGSLTKFSCSAGSAHRLLSGAAGYGGGAARSSVSLECGRPCAAVYDRGAAGREYRRKSVDFCRTEGRRLAEGLKKFPDCRCLTVRPISFYAGFWETGLMRPFCSQSWSRTGC